MKRGRPLKNSSFSKLQSAMITMAEISQNDFEKSTDRKMKEKLNKTVQIAEENTNVVVEILQLSHDMPQHNSIRNSHDSKDEQKERLDNIIKQVHIMLQQQGSSNDQMINRNNQKVDQNNTEKAGNEGNNEEAVMNDQKNASSTDINEDLADSEADKDDDQDDPINTSTADRELGDREEDKDNDGQNPNNTENNGDSGDSETDEDSHKDFLSGGMTTHYFLE